MPSWSYVQGVPNINLNVNGSSFSLAFPATVTPGDIVIGSIFFGAAVTDIISSITDDQLNNYNKIVTQLNTGDGNSEHCLFWSAAALTNGPQTVTFNFSTPLSSGRALTILDEFTPSASIVATDGFNGTSSSTFNSGPYPTGSFTPANNGDLIYAVGWIDGTSTVPAAPAGYTQCQGTGNGAINQYTQSIYQIQAVAAPINPTFPSGGVFASVAGTAISASNPAPSVSNSVIMGRRRRIWWGKRLPRDTFSDHRFRRERGLFVPQRKLIIPKKVA